MQIQHIAIALDATRVAIGSRAHVLVGVVASGNLEVLVERVLPGHRIEAQIATPVAGFDAVWTAVLTDFAARHGGGGLRISINDGGARPDTVALRLAQALRMIEAAA